MITGNIQQAQPSKSGKTLRVCVADVWYSTKNAELQGKVGQAITFDPSTSVFNGEQIHWINDYQDAQAPPTADQAMQAAMAQPAVAPAAVAWQPPAFQQPAPQPQAQPAPVQAPIPANKDRDASIVAQALTKALTQPHDDVSKVWAIYTHFYCLYMAWDGSQAPYPGVTVTPANTPGYAADKPTDSPPDYDDDIPF